MERSLSMTSHSSTLSTPELSPHTSDSESSNDSGSFFSALSSTDDSHSDVSPLLCVMVIDPPSVDFPLMDVPSEKASEVKAFLGRRPAPLPLFDSPASPLPRKLKKIKPRDGSSTATTSSIRPVELLRRATGYEPLGRRKKHRRSSLPSIPSASLFPVKLREQMNTRIVKFQSPTERDFMRSRRRVARSPYPNPNASTDALVSLAWTGEFPSQGSPVQSAQASIGDTFFHSSMSIAGTSLRRGWKSTWSLSAGLDDTDQETPSTMQTSAGGISILSRQPRDPRKGHRRRWTLAMAITDEGISDEMLLDELEKMRTIEKMWRCEWEKPDATSPAQATPRSTQEMMLKPSLPCLSDPALSAVWQSARRALLICRELVRTERHYLQGLRTLASSQTLTPPPPLMLTYLPALVQVSETLMSKMEHNPSAQGVAAAFLSVENELDAALVSWCGVVGGFFVGNGPSPSRERLSSASPPQNAAEEKSIKRRVNSWGRRINSIKALTSSVPSTPTHAAHKENRGPPVRDLAILPTQRVMRYTLLFKDLFSHTPINNTSTPDVERAMLAAISIAQKCDRAQDNAAFLHESA